MRKIYCDCCLKFIAKNSKNYCIKDDELHQKEFEEEVRNYKASIFSSLMRNFDLCEECEFKLWTNFERMMEEDEEQDD